jgi:hypothetical protein
VWGQAGRQLTVFEDHLERLIKGHYPVGYAVEVFNNRYAEISTDLSSRIEDARFGMKPNDMEMANLWTANNDARNYVVLGDPAVRIPVGGTASQERPALDSVVVRSTPAAPAVPEAPAAAAPAQEPAAEVAPAPAFEAGGQAEAGEGAGAGLPALAETLHAVLARALQGYGSAQEVATYSGLEAMPGAKPAALTRILADGSLETWVAEAAAQNEALLATHREMVAQALAHRAAVIRAAAKLAGD